MEADVVKVPSAFPACHSLTLHRQQSYRGIRLQSCKCEMICLLHKAESVSMLLREMLQRHALCIMLFADWTSRVPLRSSSNSCGHSCHHPGAKQTQSRCRGQKASCGSSGCRSSVYQIHQRRKQSVCQKVPDEFEGAIGDGVDHSYTCPRSGIAATST
jgi:hypothetical protein